MKKWINKFSSALWLIAVVSVFCVISLKAEAADDEQLPVRFDGIINAAAAQHELNPLLVKALIWRESRFNPRAKGKRGEIGLMQIKRAVVIDWAKEHNAKVPSSEELYDPENNIWIGTWYLGQAMNNWADNPNQIMLALCEYNAGRKQLLCWIVNHDGNCKAAIENSSSASYAKAVMEKFLELALAKKSFFLVSNPDQP